MKRHLSLVLLTICFALLGSSIPIAAQDNKPTESLSLNFGVIADALIGTRSGNLEITDVSMVGSADGITTSVEVVDYLSDGTQTTHSIIAILIGLVRNDRVVWRLNDITIDGEAATAQQARAVQRVVLRAWNNYIRQQIGVGRRTETVDLNETFITLHFR
jgi:hypothetical protein